MRLFFSVGFLVLGHLSAALGADPIVVVASPDGNDANDGSADKPYQSLARVQKAVRAIRAKAPDRDVIVKLRGGKYLISEPIRFRAEDAGNEQSSVVYAAWPGEQPFISGGRRITGWQRGPGNVWTVTLADVKAGQWRFRQLFRGDTRLTRARFPNAGERLQIRTVSEDLQSLTFDREIPALLSAEAAELVVGFHWNIARVRVAGYRQGTLSTRTPAGHVGNPQQQLRACPGYTAYLENDPAFLDAAGEWFLNPTSGVLSYVAADGEDPNKQEMIAPVAAGWLDIEGTADRPVRNLRFEGITFVFAEPPPPPDGYIDVQAGHFCASIKNPANPPLRPESAAVILARAANCRWEKCRFAHTSTCGVAFGPGTTNAALVGCSLDDIGGNGVMIGWRDRAELEDKTRINTDWKHKQDVPRGNKVQNCLVTRCGQINFGGVGLFVAFASGTVLEHNEIHTMPYTGISVGYSWNSNPTSLDGCSIRFNSIHNVMLELADGAGIYTLGLQPKTVLAGNWVRHVKRGRFAVGAPNNGFFLDQGSKGFHIESNVIHDTSGEPVRYHEREKEWHTYGKNYLGVQPKDSAAAQAIADAAGIQKSR